jgi:murein DD-endopeptidase MepM/ murein hydrolase activator NlpD
MSEQRQQTTDHVAQSATAALARHVSQQASRQVARSAAVRFAGRGLARGLTALLFKAGGLLGAKALAIGAIVLGAALLVIGLVLLVLATVGAAFQNSTAVWPVPVDVRDDGTYRAGGWAISSRFGWRQSPFTSRPEFHDGIDIVNPTGGCPFGHRCPLPAMFDGVVEYVGWDQSGTDDPEASGGGQIVIVENGQEDHRFLYAHLEPYRLHVQLQGRIEDDHRRYDDARDYQPIGRGELTPDLADGAIEMWCALDMPGFRATRSSPGTVTFTYDRPAQCRTSVVWGQKGDGWDGWVADDPPADQDGRATLAWQTPIESGKRAGDVALRFRAHLVPPPPPPTTTPTPGLDEPGSNPAPPGLASEPATRPVERAGHGGVAQGWNGGAHETGGLGQPAHCETQAPGVRCVWRIADIPPADARMSAPQQQKSDSSAIGGMSARDEAVEQVPTPIVTPPSRSPQLILVSTVSRPAVPTGGRFSVAVSLFTDGNGASFPVAVRSDGALTILEARATSGTCTASGASAVCTVQARAGAPATMSIVFEVLPGNTAGRRLAITSTVTDGDRHVAEQVLIAVEGYAVTPGPWPPPTLPPPPTQTPLPTAEPVSPTPDLYATPRPTAMPTPAPPGQGPGGGPAACAPQALVQLPDVVNAHGRTDTTRLIAPAAAAFQRVRAEIVAQTGQDPLARLADALRAPEFRTDKPGVARMSWHMTGRAIDVDTSYPWRRVRDGRFWRLYLGAVDVTAIFARHGFTRIADRPDSPEWWHYEYRPDGISWARAMLQVYPVSRLVAAFPEIAWASVGCQPHGDGPVIGPMPDDAEICVAGSPAFSTAVEEIYGCGPPVRVGDRVFMLNSTLGFVGMTGQTTGPHLHLGLQVRGYDGQYHQTDICTPDWLHGMTPAQDADCWTEMADPEAFLPHAPPPEALAARSDRSPGRTPTAIIPEGAPYQLPPPNYPGSLLAETGPDAAPGGQYWSPYEDGGQYGGGGTLEWFVGTTCERWSGFPWCEGR